MNSIWMQNLSMPQFEPLTRDIKTDVLIIGGGMAGLLCAWQLERSGVDYVLVEANRLCSGITQNTTAKITSQHGLIYDKIFREYGLSKARLYHEANQKALEQYRELCRNIDCDFENRDSYVYALSDEAKLEKEVEALAKIGFSADLESGGRLPFPLAGAVRFKNQAQFHPLKFAGAIAKDLRIFEHTKVLELLPGKAVTHGGNISAKRIIIATHYPVLNKHGAYFLKLYQHRSYVLALNNAPVIDGMYVDEAKTGLSFRGYGDTLLLGGGGHRTGKKGGGWRELEEFAHKYYPKAQIQNRWATQDCMSLDGIPYIGQYSKNTPELFVSTGFNKWGMTSAMVGAMILADLLQGKKNPYAEVFSPSRSIMHPQLAVNAAESAINLMTPTVPRCPHMGCALKYNKEEHSWDCPCHGSRFTENGKLIDNPATDDKK